MGDGDLDATRGANTHSTNGSTDSDAHTHKALDEGRANKRSGGRGGNKDEKKLSRLLGYYAA
jgi:hypothetical protein